MQEMSESSGAEDQRNGKMSTFPIRTLPACEPVMDAQLHSSPETEPVSPSADVATSSGEGAAVSTASANTGVAQQPKIVQTAFVHKLYSMLEDVNIQDLISWSSNNESFIMAPTAEFAKVLAQYFKHTNISSFVRQLNMYGFHKVSDVFHTGTPDSLLWEFKHGNGSFKRGDLSSLKDIKRRASRHTIAHRESFTSPTHHKSSLSQPGTPAEPTLDPHESRILQLEHRLYDLHIRLSRSEDYGAALSSRCAFLQDGLARTHHWTGELARMVAASIPDADHPLKKQALAVEHAVARQAESAQQVPDNPPEVFLRHPYYTSNPTSPRHGFGEEPRRSLRHVRPLGPQSQHSSSGIPRRRFGSIGGGSERGALPAYQQGLATVIEPSAAARRHTSGDIRIPPWPGHTQSLPNSISQPTFCTTQKGESLPDPHIREQLATFEFGKPTSRPLSALAAPSPAMRHTPPFTSHEITPSTMSMESGYSWSSRANRASDSTPATRRSSMASNVHSLLNPSDDAQADERKRKRT